MNGRKARTKGKRGEQEAARLLAPLFPNVRRAWEAASGLGYDLDNTGDFRFQIKMQRTCVSLMKLAEVPGPMPVLMQRRDRGKWVVAFPSSVYVRVMGHDDWSNPEPLSIEVAVRKRRHLPAAAAEELGLGQVLVSINKATEPPLNALYLMGYETFARWAGHYVAWRNLLDGTT